MSTWGRAQEALYMAYEYEDGQYGPTVLGPIGEKLQGKVTSREWTDLVDTILDTVGPIFQETAERPHRQITWKLAQSEPGQLSTADQTGFCWRCRYCDGSDYLNGQKVIDHKGGCVWVDATEQIAKEREDMGKAMRLASIGVDTDAFDVLAKLIEGVLFDDCSWCSSIDGRGHDSDCPWMKADALVADEGGKD